MAWNSGQFVVLAERNDAYRPLYIVYFGGRDQKSD